MAWTEVMYKGKKYSIDIQNFYLSTTTNETVAFEDLPKEKIMEYKLGTTREFAKAFGYKPIGS